MKDSHSWPDRRLLDLLGIEMPLIQAPMAGFAGSRLAIAVAEAGALGSLACALLSPDQIREEAGKFAEARGEAPLNLNFFCHQMPEADAEQAARWKERLAPYYAEFGVDPSAASDAPLRLPFDSAACAVVEELRPRAVSFHFGLPTADLLSRVQATGAKIFASATTLEEALWLEDRGCDVIIAQGLEAGGHRGMFLSRDLSRQIGAFALVRQVVDAVRVPVVAAGGIGDGRGIAAAVALGAAGVQIGTAYLLCAESTVSPIHRRELEAATTDSTAITNVQTGRPARAILNRLMREQGPVADDAPEFPFAASALVSLRRAAESAGLSDFSPLWCGQYPPRGRGAPATELTRQMAAEALEVMRGLAC